MKVSVRGTGMNVVRRKELSVNASNHSFFEKKAFPLFENIDFKKGPLQLLTEGRGAINNYCIVIMVVGSIEADIPAFR